MPFTKGKSGNPRGRPKGSFKDKPFTDNLRRVMLDPDLGQLGKADNDKTPLRLAVEQLALAAVDGKLDAIKEIADRLEGRPAQTIDQNINDSTVPDTERHTRIAELLERGGAGRAIRSAGAGTSTNGTGKPH